MSDLRRDLGKQAVNRAEEHGRVVGVLNQLQGQIAQAVEDQGRLFQDLDRAQAALAQDHLEAIKRAASSLETALTGLQERFSEEAKHTRSLAELHGKSLELLEGKLIGRLVGMGRLVLTSLIIGAATLGWLVFSLSR